MAYPVQAQTSAKAVFLPAETANASSPQKSVILTCLSTDATTLTCQDGKTPQQLAQRAGLPIVDHVTQSCEKAGQICRLFVEAHQRSE